MDMSKEIHKRNATPDYREAAKVLTMLRALGSEEQRIAYAFMEGMKTQKFIDRQSVNPKD